MKTLKSNLPTILANGSIVLMIVGPIILSIIYGIHSGGLL